mmetsp:Transcript_78805/g.225779  ORF Transcript_78805/g.225779 Transcript_78805/m.225779 type:complete len:341 (+) Transcript_78805:65-1087(+)
MPSTSDGKQTGAAADSPTRTCRIRMRSISLCSLGQLRVMLFVHLVGAVQLVQPGDVAVVAIELLMVEIVKGGLVVVAHPWPVEATMMGLRAQDAEHHPAENREAVRAERYATSEQRDHIGYQHLKRVAVNGDESDGRSELVVQLVALPVDGLVVQQAVAVVEEHLVHEDEADGLQTHLFVRRQGLAHVGPDACHVPKQRDRRSEREDNEGLVEEEVLHNPAELLHVELLVLLELVLLQHLRSPNGVKEQKKQTIDPVDDDRHQRNDNSCQLPSWKVLHRELPPSSMVPKHAPQSKRKCRRRGSACPQVHGQQANTPRVHHRKQTRATFPRATASVGSPPP